MPKLKRTVTPARLAANRLAALKSTGPRTLRGKQPSSLRALRLNALRLNALRPGRHSNTIELLWKILANAPSFGLLQVARQLMTPAQLAVVSRFVVQASQPAFGPSAGKMPQTEPDPDPRGFLYDLDEVRKTRGVGKGQSKPKSPLESA